MTQTRRNRKPGSYIQFKVAVLIHFKQLDSGFRRNDGSAPWYSIFSIARFVILNFGHWDLFDICDLLFVISDSAICKLIFSKILNLFKIYQDLAPRRPPISKPMNARVKKKRIMWPSLVKGININRISPVRTCAIIIGS